MRKFLDEWSLGIGVALMIFLSATAAYIKQYEKAEQEWPIQKHISTWFFKLIYSGFSGLLIWYGAESLIQYGYKVPQPLIPVLIGIAGFSGAQFIDFVGVTLLDYGRKKLGLEAKEQKV